MSSLLRLPPDSMPLNSSGQGVALISMPVIRPGFPCLALGLLKALLEQKGIECDDFPFYLDFVAAAGAADNNNILHWDSNLAGDFVFTGELDPPGVDESVYLQEVLARNHISAEDAKKYHALLPRVRRQIVPAFLDRLLEDHDWSRYELIGFTSTFQQHAASLAFARRLKQRYPHVPIILGGANLWGEMGLAWLEYAPYIDYVCTGEGDVCLPQMIHALRDQRDIDTIPNIAHRLGGRIVAGPEQPINMSLDSLPYPNYDSYFERVESVGVGAEALTFEASRGCWWGEVRHCVFCGLNNSAMSYRSKSPERVYEEIKALNKRYRLTSFYAVDNILDRRYIPTLFRWIDEDGLDLTFFFEIKSNMNLHEIRSMWRAGVREVQPGIESLSTPILRLMRKGVTGIQNVFLLKWLKYFNIQPEWNILCGFFQEQPEHYAQQEDWMRKLFHIAPPIRRVQIVLERYTPLFDHPADHGVSDVRASSLYRALYPDSRIDQKRIAYYFDHVGAERLPDESLHALDEVVVAWRLAQARGASLTFTRLADRSLLIVDTRLDSPGVRCQIPSPAAEIFELAGAKLAPPAKLANELNARHGFDLSAEQVKDWLEQFVKFDFAIKDEGLYLTLALPVSRRYFDPPRLEPEPREDTGQAENSKNGCLPSIALKVI